MGSLHTLPLPSLARSGAALYLFDASGERGRVHDARFTGGKPQRIALGAAEANTRNFVSKDGEHREYTLSARRSAGVRRFYACAPLYQRRVGERLSMCPLLEMAGRRLAPYASRRPNTANRDPSRKNCTIPSSPCCWCAGFE